MKKVAIVGLGWLGMPLALSLTARGWQVTGSKTTQDGVEAARMCGIDSYPLRLEPQLVCDTEDLDALMNVDALVITLPARRTGAGEGFYLQAVQEIVDTALAYHSPRIGVLVLKPQLIADTIAIHNLALAAVRAVAEHRRRQTELAGHLRIKEAARRMAGRT